MTEYLNVQQAAEVANISTKTIRRAIAAGNLEAFRVGRAIRLREADVRAWVEADPVKPTAAPARTASPRPRKLPTTAAQQSAARMRAMEEEYERQRKG